MRNGKGRLAGQSAIVTGGTSGIGRELVERFVAEGAHVCFTGRRASLGEEIANATGARFVTADMRDIESLDNIVSTAKEANGRIDILVNNAGNPGPTGALEDIAIEDLDETFTVHLRGTFAMVQAIIPVMKDQGSGVILNMSSIAGHRVGGHSHAYSIIKAGVSHLTQIAAAELGPSGIRVNALSPGFIPTEIHGRAMGRSDDQAMRVADALKPMFLTMQSIPHTGTSADVADAAVFLASDEARFITGVDLLVDGGLALGKPRRIVPAGERPSGTSRTEAATKRPRSSGPEPQTPKNG